MLNKILPIIIFITFWTTIITLCGFKGVLVIIAAALIFGIVKGLLRRNVGGRRC